MDVDLQSLRVFCELAATASFSEVGRRVGLSQPAVSQTIARLEAQAGLVLLERGGNGVRLTPAGTLFFKRAEEVYREFEAFVDGTSLIARRADRVVCVGLDASLHAATLHQQATGLSWKKASQVEWRHCGGNWLEDLEEGRVDVVIACRYLQAGTSPSIQQARIACERGMTVAWNPGFHPFDPEQFHFPEVLRTTVLLPDQSVLRGFSEFLQHWFTYAYGGGAANVEYFASEGEAARAAAAGLGVFLSGGDAMSRLGASGEGLRSVRTFEFLLPEAFTFGVYCRVAERAKEVLEVAAGLATQGRRSMAL